MATITLGEFACRINFVHKPRRISRKPVIYLYAPSETTVNVKLKVDGEFLITEPAYNNGWNVIAHSDGTVTNIADGKHFPYLYWEAAMKFQCRFETGYVIPGDSAEFLLRKILPETGLQGKEINDFIEYWLPDLSRNEFNLVTFPLEEYEKKAKMIITPQPDQILRVFMAFKSIPERTTIPAPTFSEFSRTGFHVVEWGGVDMDLAHEELQ